MSLEKLKNLLWDRSDSISPEEIYRFLSGEIEIPGLNRSQWRAKALLSIRWYDLVAIFGFPVMKDFLSDEVLQFIWKEDLRNSYYYARNVIERALQKSL